MEVSKLTNLVVELRPGVGGQPGAVVMQDHGTQSAVYELSGGLSLEMWKLANSLDPAGTGVSRMRSFCLGAALVFETTHLPAAALGAYFRHCLGRLRTEQFEDFRAGLEWARLHLDAGGTVNTRED